MSPPANTFSPAFINWGGEGEVGEERRGGGGGGGDNKINVH